MYVGHHIWGASRQKPRLGIDFSKNSHPYYICRVIVQVIKSQLSFKKRWTKVGKQKFVLIPKIREHI